MAIIKYARPPKAMPDYWTEIRMKLGVKADIVINVGINDDCSFKGITPCRWQMCRPG